MQVTDRHYRGDEIICFCKQIIHKTTKANTYRHTIDITSYNKYDEEVTKTVQLCGQMFRRGEYYIKGKPYGELPCPPLPDLSLTGKRKGMLHLAGLCPRHAVLFEDRLYDQVKDFHVHGSDDEDSVHSGDDPADPLADLAAPSSSPSSTSSSNKSPPPPTKKKNLLRRKLKVKSVPP